VTPDARTVTTADGLRIAVHELGGTGPDLLLAHATGFHGMVWAPVAARLADRYHCVAFDHRAHGDSDRPPAEGLTWPAYASDTAAVVADVGGRPFGLGHSMGGTCLLLAELARPGTFAALALFEPVVFAPGTFPAGGENPLAEPTRRRRAEFSSLAEAEANYASKPPMDTFDSSVRAAYVHHGLRANGDGMVTLKCRPEDEARTYELGLHNGVWDRLGQVTCPVLVLRGAPGTPGPAGVAAQVAERLPNGRLHADDELTHFGPLERPDRVADAAAEFFEALDRS